METYRRSILDALHASIEDEETDNYDDEHLCSIARWLAEDGDLEARDALYKFVTAVLEYGGETGADKIVALDGIEGFTHIVKIVTQKTHTDIDTELFYGGWYTYILQDKHGEEQATALLQEAAAQNESVAAYLQAVALNDARRERNREKRANRPYEDYAALQELIKDSTIKDHRGRLRRWGRKSNDDDLTRAAADLLEANDNKQILNYLNIFRIRAFPLDPARLIALTESEDDAIVEAAYGALKEIHHSAVRAHALQLLASSRRPAEAVDLLAINFEEGDQALISHVLSQPLTDDEIHSIGLSVLDIIESDPHPDDIEILMTLYEREPCSFCREYIVDALITLDRVPEWMRIECRYDASGKIRAMSEEKYGNDDHLPKGLSKNNFPFSE